MPYLNDEELVLGERGMYVVMSEKSVPEVVVKEREDRTNVVQKQAMHQ